MATQLAARWTDFERDEEHPTDESLVALAKGGNRDAFDELVRRHRRTALKTATAIAGPDRAEDVVQDALILAFRALPTLQDFGRFPQWLGTITRFRALRLMRVEGRRAAGRVPFDDTRIEAAASSAVPEDESAIPRLEAALNRIPAPFEKVLRLHFLEGVPHQRIAEELGVTLSTSKWRCFRGKQLLRSLLQPNDSLAVQVEDACKRCQAACGSRSCGELWGGPEAGSDSPARRSARGGSGQRTACGSPAPQTFNRRATPDR